MKNILKLILVSSIAVLIIFVLYLDYSNVKKIEKPKEVLPDMVPEWYTIAYREIGQKEKPGKDNNSKIIDYHSVTSLQAIDDETPWCASFVSWCLEMAQVKSAKSARALDYANFGEPLETPRVGAICVFSRTGGGHVGFFAEEKENEILVLGGNQADAVNLMWLPKVDLLAYRWPSKS